MYSLIFPAIPALICWSLFCGDTAVVHAEDLVARVKLDASEAPDLKMWGISSKRLIEEWYPRVVNLLPTEGHRPPRNLRLRIKESDKGFGATSGNTITVSSEWIRKHPDDKGLVLRELVHVVQAYPSDDPSWVTDGIADYLRWGIYEPKTLESFPRPREIQGYKKGNRVAAGFLLWLESGKSPGVVKKLNTAMRRGTYSDELFRQETGQSLDELWDSYAMDVERED